jgi:hypothetical protein
MITKFADLKPIFEVDIHEVLAECIDNKETKDVILRMNKSQLWDGKSKTGDDLRPYYSEDPYFKTKEKAIAYRNWKKRITSNSIRNDDAPNLFINGYFYRSITIDRGAKNVFEFGGKNSLATDIINKYPLALGLTNENYIKLTWDYLFDSLRENLLKRLKVSL